MRLKTRILTTTILLAVLFLIGISSLSSSALEGMLERQLVERERPRLELLVKIIEQSGMQGIHGRVRDLALSPGTRVIVMDESGTLLYDSAPGSSSEAADIHSQPDVADAIHRGYGVHRFPDPSTGNLVFFASMKTSPARGGPSPTVVRISETNAEILDTIGFLRLVTLGGGLIAVLVVAGVSMFLARKISDPIEEIVSVVERIKGGEVGARIAGAYGGEMGEMATAINNMAEKLSSDISTLERLERVRSEFLGNVSHELRTPIFSLQGFLETLLDGAVDDPQVNRQFLAKALKHGERLSTLLGDLIEISRIESGEMKLSFRYFSILEFLEALIEEMTPAAESKGIALFFESGFDQSAKAYGDRARLRQVMINLIDNAIKYTDPGGTVRSIARPLKSRCEILVTDSGCGIPAEHLSRIFERFYRVDRDRSREIGGTGLGLAIVKHIVEAHGSTVTVNSTPGQGSTFSFTLKR